MMGKMKICTGCRQRKPSSGFYARSGAKCKACIRKAVAKRRAEKIERVRAYDRERGRDPERKKLVRLRAHKYRDRRSAYNRKWRLENPEKAYAYSKVQYAIRLGKLVKKPCEECGDADVHAHHDDYSKPLDVRWLCLEHHGIESRID